MSRSSLLFSQRIPGGTFGNTANPEFVLAVVVHDAVYGVYEIIEIESEGKAASLVSKAHRRFDEERGKWRPKRILRTYKYERIASFLTGATVSGWKRAAIAAVLRSNSRSRLFAELKVDLPPQPLNNSRRPLAVARTPEQLALPLEVIKRAGAGFGDSETNRKVEKAAVTAVTDDYVRGGYVVKSRESERVGYDLDATKRRTTLHVEVKGVQGDLLQFPITAREVECATDDKAFRLAVVTNALNPKLRRIREFSGSDLLRRFQLRPLAFIATLSDEA